MGNKKVDFNFKGKKLDVSTDLDQDGVKSIRVMIDLPEIYQEALKRGETVVVEGVKAVSLKMEGFKLVTKIDTDRDNEPAMIVEADLPEVFDEATSLGKEDEKK